VTKEKDELKKTDICYKLITRNGTFNFYNKNYFEVKFCGFEVLTVVKMTMLLSWVVMPCGLIVIYQRFRKNILSPS
jgi:hypothetical protein